MPKLKSHSGAKKRFSLTKTGKVKRAKAFKSHILTKKDNPQDDSLQIREQATLRIGGF